MLKRLSFAAVGITIAASAVLAGSHSGGPFDAAIQARQAHMQLYAHNLGILGGMAKGAVDYDADTASAAATNLATLSTMSQRTYWPQGSDSFDNQNSRALPDIWENFPDVGEKGAAMVAASAAMQTAAGNGLEALQGAMGGVGKACGSCHKSYRKPADE